jgi:3-oxoadipate enol-lactonase
LLFLNGSGSSIATSELLIKLFTGDFDVLVHDQRGLGDSEIPPGPYTMADYAADAAALLDHAGWERARVVGVSFGGMVAQELAVTWPERVERLALLCTSPGGAGGASYPLHELAGLPEAERDRIGLALLDSRFTPEWLAAHPSDQALADMMAARRAGTKTSEQLRGEELQLEARSRHDVCDRLDRITCPTLVACGRFDAIAPPSNGEAIAARIPGAELRVYEGGHAFFAQDPEALPHVISFLAG